MPKMNGVFGKWDWVANGVLMATYHWHQPWGMLVGEKRAALDGSEYDYLYQVVIGNAKRRIEVRRQGFRCDESLSQYADVVNV